MHGKTSRRSNRSSAMPKESSEMNDQPLRSSSDTMMISRTNWGLSRATEMATSSGLSTTKWLPNMSN